MFIDNFEKSLLIQSLVEQQKLKAIFYEIINSYSIKCFDYQENSSIFNKITKINNNSNEIKIETDAKQLFAKLESNLVSLNENFKEINSLVYSFNQINNENNTIIKKVKINNKNKYIINNFIDVYMKYTLSLGRSLFTKFDMSNHSNKSNDLIIFEKNYFHNLINKRALIGKYFRSLKIKCNKKNKNNREFFQIKINVHNTIIVYIIFPLNLNKFYENDYHKKIKVIVNGIYGPKNVKNIHSEDNLFNNYSNFKFYNKLEKLFNNKLKEIFKDLNKISFNNKISFYEAFVSFLDYIYDYNKIFKMKCGKCLNKLKYISEEKYFSVPFYKISCIDEKYITELKYNIEKEQDISNNLNKNAFGFFHVECINY